MLYQFNIVLTISINERMMFLLAGNNATSQQGRKMITSINEVIKEVRNRLAQKVSQRAVSTADYACKQERKLALADGIDGVSEFLNASREREVSDGQLRDMGLVVSEDQARLWYGICNRLGGLCVSPFDGQPIDAESAVRFRIECDLEALKSERPERRENKNTDSYKKQSGRPRIDA